ncbi:hypothetical protein EV189_3707 [Motilibacter rhizosphaerae]|uniref:Pyrroline-5-carboxylate reductase catalytic N-terminal domain-containing protein n=1 Tax=Motilibacter rhizosphaerae TaxID=598652 RepID=A0A4Q7NBI7_9ACTN|nr:NAD(P)-binding domain-containing protein [Motilibacter rhizosphaerae]RZS80223.1 hypothetical protein EV189_3707 [Motilibacter rhizosphaerae]
MRTAVLGTGMVGQHIAGRLAELGHEVVVGTRDPAASLAREDAGWGARPLRVWLDAHPGVRVAAFRDAVADAELVVGASGGDVTLAVLEAVGAQALGERVYLDVANPLQHGEGLPTLSVCNTDSLGEQVQRAYPRLRVVKALNTLTAPLMVHPETLGEDTTVFVAGDDAEAKALVTGVLRAFGHADVLDLGGIEAARGMEMWLPLWLRIAGALGGSGFNVKVVRSAPHPR